MGSKAEAPTTNPVTANPDEQSMDAVTPGVEPPNPKKFLNGWTKELEVLFAEWTDKAACYRWMHDRTARQCHSNDQRLMLPIIILSTVGGAANFAMSSISQDRTTQNYIQLGLGGISIFTGILTTIANRLGYASSAEAHRGASVQWGKFNRLIIIELSLHPDERMEAFAFLKMFRIELDRLIEQSPSIPDNIIQSFIYEFKEMTDIKRPDITGNIEHTKVFSDSNTRLKKIAEEAALTLAHKKGILKQLVLDDLDAKVRNIVRDTVKNTNHVVRSSHQVNVPTSGSPASFTIINQESPTSAPDSVISTIATNTIPSINAIDPTNPLSGLHRGVTYIPPPSGQQAPMTLKNPNSAVTLKIRSPETAPKDTVVLNIPSTAGNTGSTGSNADTASESESNK
jgi:hypothetical protein